MITYAQQPTLVSRTTITARAWTFIGFIAVMCLATFFYFYHLEQEGYANLYYAAAVKSMSFDLRAFFFNSLDTGLFVTVDKPPLGLWVQVLSVWVFGYSGWALLMPQALAGVFSVALLYWLVYRTFGAKAAFIAALVLAVSPISVAANRNNTMDSQLVFTSLLAALAISFAAERGQLRWLLVCAIFVGIGFNIKMLQAYMVLPAFYLLYFIAPPIAWWKRILHLGLATLILVAISFSWAVIVDLTPTDQRPFIGSSTDNTVMELIAGHNGIRRLGSLGNLFSDQETPPNQTQPNNPPQAAQPPNGFPPRNPNQNQPPAGAQPNRPPNGQPPNDDGPQPNQPAGAPGGETGSASLFRLFNDQLAAQNTWLLPLSLLCLVIGATVTRIKLPLDRKHQSLILWGGWLIPQIVFFSYAGLFHRYYLEMMSPAIAALVGIGVAVMWDDYREGKWRGWLLPVALIVGAVTEIFILRSYADWSRWLTPLIGGVTVVSMIVIIALQLIRFDNRIARGLIVSLGLAALLVAPTVWASTPLASSDSGLPFAGPELLNHPNRGNGLQDQSKLIQYLSANRNGAKFLLATMSARDAAPFIIPTGEAVMAMGGFSGRDDIISPSDLERYVAANEVRFFYVPRMNNNASNVNQDNNDLVQWINQRCAPVQNFSSTPQPGPNQALQLFDCKR